MRAGLIVTNVIEFVPALIPDPHIIPDGIVSGRETNPQEIALDNTVRQEQSIHPFALTVAVDVEAEARIVIRIAHFSAHVNLKEVVAGFHIIGTDMNTAARTLCILIDPGVELIVAVSTHVNAHIIPVSMCAAAECKVDIRIPGHSIPHRQTRDVGKTGGALGCHRDHFDCAHRSPVHAVIPVIHIAQRVIAGPGIDNEFPCSAERLAHLDGIARLEPLIFSGNPDADRGCIGGTCLHGKLFSALHARRGRQGNACVMIFSDHNRPSDRGRLIPRSIQFSTIGVNTLTEHRPWDGQGEILPRPVIPVKVVIPFPPQVELNAFRLRRGKIQCKILSGRPFMRDRSKTGQVQLAVRSRNFHPYGNHIRPVGPAVPVAFCETCRQRQEIFSAVSEFKVTDVEGISTLHAPVFILIPVHIDAQFSCAGHVSHGHDGPIGHDGSVLHTLGTEHFKVRRIRNIRTLSRDHAICAKRVKPARCAAGHGDQIPAAGFHLVGRKIHGAVHHVGVVNPIPVHFSIVVDGKYVCPAPYGIAAQCNVRNLQNIADRDSGRNRELRSGQTCAIARHMHNQRCAGDPFRLFIQGISIKTGLRIQRKRAICPIIKVTVDVVFTQTAKPFPRFITVPVKTDACCVGRMNPEINVLMIIDGDFIPIHPGRIQRHRVSGCSRDGEKVILHRLCGIALGIRIGVQLQDIPVSGYQKGSIHHKCSAAGCQAFVVIQPRAGIFRMKQAPAVNDIDSVCILFRSEGIRNRQIGAGGHNGLLRQVGGGLSERADDLHGIDREGQCFRAVNRFITEQDFRMDVMRTGRQADIVIPVFTDCPKVQVRILIADNTHEGCTGGIHRKTGKSPLCHRTLAKADHGRGLCSIRRHRHRDFRRQSGHIRGITVVIHPGLLIHGIGTQGITARRQLGCRNGDLPGVSKLTQINDLVIAVPCIHFVILCPFHCAERTVHQFTS